MESCLRWFDYVRKTTEIPMRKEDQMEDSSIKKGGGPNKTRRKH